ncbi:hypothetical protein [Ruminococcus flavefaciens]|uniref:hypothetical protein n=1 Tax=Ruminococcus flavefaciens TaxID=1265 RepID=UPI00048F0428|nr:hypothetical protein [Ruminococcus flavefaciens]
MRSSRIAALLTAGALTLSLLSCTDNDPPRQSRVRDTSREYAIGQSGGSEQEIIPEISDYCPDLDTVEEAVSKLIDDIDKGNTSALDSDINNLLELYDEIYEARSVKELEFYAHYSNEEMENEFNEVYRILYVAGDMMRAAFVRGYYSDHRSYFEKYVTDEDIEFYKDITDTDDLDIIRTESESSFDDMTENLGEYYKIIADDDLDEDEKDIKCAKILIDILQDYDTGLLYSQYDRDYTGEEILALGDSVRDELIPVMDRLIDVYVDNTDLSDLYAEYGFEDAPFEVIREYAPQLSEDLAKSADLICDEHLYRLCYNDDEAFEGAFTDELPLEDKAMIFIGSMDSDEVLNTAIHEFGHFHATFYDNTPTFLSQNNLDIAEVQSQGLELIFTRFYDEIYGSSSDSQKIMQIIDLLDSVISGYLVGEFEYKITERIDDITPEELVELFNDNMDYYDGAARLYMISHLFESPGYYISYSTSALAAFDLFDDAFNAPDKALERYEKFSRISCNSGEYSFRQALSECGFRDVLSRDYISQLADEISRFADKYK